MTPTATRTRSATRAPTSHPIVRGQNNTAAGIANAIAGGNEQQQVTLGRLQRHHAVVPDPDRRQTRRRARPGRRGGQQRQRRRRDQRDRRLRRRRDRHRRRQHRLHASRSRARRPAPTSRRSRSSTAPAPAPRRCARTPRAARRCRPGPRARRSTVGTVTDTGYTCCSAARLHGHRRRPVHGHQRHRRHRRGRRDHQGRRRACSAPARPRAVAGFGGGTFDDTGFQVTFGGTLAGLDQPPLGARPSPAAPASWARPPAAARSRTSGFIVTDTGNHAPDVDRARRPTRSRRGRRSP